MDFTPWERVLAEVIVGDAFGADRIDYLLRDAHHTGCEVRIGREGTLNSLRILPRIDSDKLTIGVTEEGLGAVEGLVMGRHLMYKDVYFHPQRKAYDFHLQGFLKAWLPQGCFPITVAEHLRLTDNEVLTAHAVAARDENLPGHDHTRRFWKREPFQLVYKRNPDDLKANSRSGKLIAKALSGQFGADAAHYFTYEERRPIFGFPILRHDGRCVSCDKLSNVLANPPTLEVEFVFIAPEQHDAAVAWLRDNREQVIAKKKRAKP